MAQPLAAFIAKWAASGAAERANKDAFLIELCDALDVPRPDPTTGDADKDRYVFEKDALTPHEGGVVTVGKIDLFKAGAFLLEAKQGSGKGSKKLGTAKRETPAWNVAMQDAYGQAAGYARTFAEPVPFLVTCDIGYCFDLYAAFDGTHGYRQFPDPQSSRLFFRDLEQHRDTLRQIFTEPLALDPSRKAAKVTREVATQLAQLAKAIEKEGHPQELVASFLMRCIFTMFAEDVGLLPEKLFTTALRDYWLPSPPSFPGGIESLWRTMNEGGHVFGAVGKILKFNGGLFANPTALPLSREALGHLLVAADCNWAEVEPAIFGTLLERALDPKERHRLGAHYTPRAYVERLVRPTIEEPLRADWELVQAEVRHLVTDAEDAKTEKAGKAKLKEAVGITHAFQKKLCSIRVLDPACGSGNFLYVTLDVFKRLEGEVLAQLESLGEKQTLLHMETIRVTPAQFHGIEVKRWAKEIAELVLWIGYLQWHFRMHGKNLPVPEPVLRDYKNIECRDAVLAWDGEPELVRDAKGKPVSRWDGETMKRSPVTGEAVPDEAATVPIYRYVNPRKAEWPEADFIVGNPPFIGGWRMRQALGDGYVEALWATYPEIPEKADYVMYWWNRAAELVRLGPARRFGLITTNSVTQIFQRRVLQKHLEAAEQPLRLAFAIPDHPWVDTTDAAAVRIAMTVGTSEQLSHARLGTVVSEVDEDHVEIRFADAVRLNPDLSAGVNLDRAQALRANSGLASPGVQLYGSGFIIEKSEVKRFLLLTANPAASRVVRPYINGRDLAARSRDAYVIDFFGLEEDAARQLHPIAFQHVIDRVRPERMQNRRPSIRDKWWRFGWERPVWRAAVESLRRFITTGETSKHRVFTFVDQRVLPDNKLWNFALEDALFLGILSSRVHVSWALFTGGQLGPTPVYNKTRCFDPFPFPVCGDAQSGRIRELAESLDAHRKCQQAAHPKLTITGMYNVLEKLRSGEPLTDKDKVIHEEGLVSVLKKLHDDLDAAVFDAYGWPHELTDEQILERLVALNAERAEEEKKGLVRWLRPDFQAPKKAAPMTQIGFAEADNDTGDEDETAAAPAAAASVAWPKKLPEQIGAIRDYVRKPGAVWSTGEVAEAFKGAKKKDVETVLESLAALGLLLAYETEAGRRWKGAGA